MTTDFHTRLRRLRTIMAEQNLKAFVLTPGAAMRYLSGFSEEGYERLLALVIPQDPALAPAIVAPRLHADQVRANAANISDISLWDDSAGWQEVLRTALLPMQGKIGVDDGMPARFVLPLTEMFPQSRFVLAGLALAPLRAVKDAEELTAMQRAADATDRLLPSVYASCREGVTETEVAQVIHNTIAEHGWAASFSPIIGAGANGALPHHHIGSATLQKGDVVILDMGVQVDGYCGDITRTVAVGKASDEARRVYEIVYQAHQAGVQAVCPGATGHDVDAAARRVIEDAGYGTYFVHRTGHGIGLEDHEPPYIVAGNHVPLRPGECFSIEPGIYLPGQFGVRLENIVTVREDGTARVFNEAISPKLMVL